MTSTGTCVVEGATVIIVAYGTLALDLGWVPPETPVIVVHNDDLLDPSKVEHPKVMHVRNRENVGFGRAVNGVLGDVETSRTVLVNPDTRMSGEQWAALSSGGSREVVVVPLVDAEGVPTAMVNRYPTPLSLTLTALRVGRLLVRESALRRTLLRLLGRWGRTHAQALRLALGDQSWPATTHWACAAACAYPTDLVRAVGGFDARFFLYLEDVDLSARLAAADPELRVTLRAVKPGVHFVSASSGSPAGRRRADLEQARSAYEYARHRPGLGWKVTTSAMWMLGRWRARRTPFSTRSGPSPTASSGDDDG